MKGNVRDLEVEIAEQENRRATSLVLETNEKIGEMIDTVKAGVATKKAELRSLEEEMAEQENRAINLLKEKISDVGADVKVLNERMDRVEESVARTEADMATDKLKAVEIPKIIVDPNSKRRYERGRFLGKGGFAKCYELKDLTTGDVTAGKIVQKSLLTKSYHKEWMAQEIRLHKAVSHPHVVQLYSVFEDPNFVYIVLELCRFVCLFVFGWLYNLLFVCLTPTFCLHCH